MHSIFEGALAVWLSTEGPNYGTDHGVRWNSPEVAVGGVSMALESVSMSLNPINPKPFKRYKPYNGENLTL